ncbi:hypothetical protein BST61_g6842 [Cercospora zeina]
MLVRYALRTRLYIACLAMRQGAQRTRDAGHGSRAVIWHGARIDESSFFCFTSRSDGRADTPYPVSARLPSRPGAQHDIP